jgi:hypothetical protein
MFNLAQAIFLQSRQEECPDRARKMLMKSAKVYEYGLKIMCQAGDDGGRSILYFMCAWNNFLAHIYGRLGNSAKSNAFSHHQLLRMAMLYLSEVQTERPNPLLHSCFLANTIYSLFQLVGGIQTAPAA